MPNSNLTSHDCKELAAMMSTHERRLNENDLWKERINGQFGQLIKSLDDSRTAQERASEITATATTALSIKMDNATSQLHQQQLEAATDRGRREQSQKNLYFFITVVGLLPLILELVDRFGK